MPVAAIRKPELEQGGPAMQHASLSLFLSIEGSELPRHLAEPKWKEEEDGGRLPSIPEMRRLFLFFFFAPHPRSTLPIPLLCTVCVYAGWSRWLPPPSAEASGGQGNGWSKWYSLGGKEG